MLSIACQLTSLSHPEFLSNTMLINRFTRRFLIRGLCEVDWRHQGRAPDGPARAERIANQNGDRQRSWHATKVSHFTKPLVDSDQTTRLTIQSYWGNSNPLTSCDTVSGCSTNSTIPVFLFSSSSSPTKILLDEVIRPFVVGRKNWIVSTSVASANANFFSRVETTKANGDTVARNFDRSLGTLLQTTAWGSSYTMT